MENTNESLGGTIKLIVLAIAMSIPGLLDAKDLYGKIEKFGSNVSMVDQKVQDAIQDISNDKKDYGGYSASNVVNMISRTLFQEGKGESSLGRKYIAAVIYNRANGEFGNIPSVIKRHAAFSCWNKMTDQDWKEFKYKIPKESIDSKTAYPNIWKECVDLAKSMYDGSFKSPAKSNINSYYNPSKVNPKWSKQLVNVETIGNHKFGYLKSEDPNVKSGDKVISKNNTTYKIQSGDTLTKIAKRFNTTVDNICKLNGIDKDSILKIGRSLKV